MSFLSLHHTINRASLAQAPVWGIMAAVSWRFQWLCHAQIVALYCSSPCYPSHILFVLFSVTFPGLEFSGIEHLYSNAFGLVLIADQLLSDSCLNGDLRKTLDLGLASDSLFGNPSCCTGYSDSVAPLQTRLNLLSLKECRIVCFMLIFMLKILFLELMDDHFVLDVLFKYLKWVPPISREDWLLWEALWFEWEIHLFSRAVSTSVLMTCVSSCFFLWWALTRTSWEFSSAIGSFLLDPGSIPLYLDSTTKTVFGFALEAELRLGCLHPHQSSALGLQEPGLQMCA